MAKIYLTKEWLEKLQQELEHLKTVRRLEIAEKLKEAISFWDLSENSEYEDARNEQAQVEHRIIDLEEHLKIVGSTEADIFSEPKMISNESPIWVAILWKKIWTKVKVQALGGTFEYKILDIK